jgi:hypothetical protein
MMKKKNSIRFKVVLFILPVSFYLSAASFVLACPRCIDATPYKAGIQMAVLFLLPIPFILLTSLFLYIRHYSKPQFPNF